MNKDDLTERLTAKEAELKILVEADNQAAQQRQQQFVANQKRASQLEGAIEVLKELREQAE